MHIYEYVHHHPYMAAYCHRHVRVSGCPLTTRWSITCANLFIHPPTLTHKHTHIGYVHSYIDRGIVGHGRM